MIVTFLMEIIILLTALMTKLTPNVDLPNWFYSTLESVVNTTMVLNGVFPVHAVLEIVLIYFGIKVAVMVARVIVWIINVFRGSGAASPV